MRAARPVGSVLALVVVCLALSALGGRSLGAQEPAEQDIAAIDIEVLRTGSGASVVPVRVTVVSRRALEGTLQVEAPNSNLSWELPLGLAANSEVEQLFVVPTDGRTTVDLSAALIVDGEELADDDTGAAAAAVNVVGVLGLTAPADELPLTPNLGTASVVEITDLTVLEGFDTVVASPAGLRSLGDAERGRLLRWAAGGRQLAVADSPGSIDAQLPTEWAGDAALVPAGAGFIRYIGVDWSTNLPPGVSTASNPQMVAGWFQPASTELLSDAGFRVPGLGAMAILLLVYLLLAGPITFVVLTQMKRQTLAWVVIPVLAVVFAVGVFGVGRFLSSGRGDAYATIIEVSPAGASVTDTVLIADDGRQTLELPEGWALQSTGLNTGNGQVGSPVVVLPTRTLTDLRFDIDAGSGGTAVVRGSRESSSAQVTFDDLRLDGTTLQGFVVNSGDETLENMLVMVGTRTTSVGAVEPGGRGEFVVELAPNAVGFAPELRTWDVDPRDGWQFGPRQRDDDDAVNNGPANGSVWLEWRASRLGTAVPDGIVTAVGWSRDIDESLVSGTGRTAVVARTQLPAPDGPLVPAQVRAVQVQGTGQNQFGEFEAFDNGEAGMVSQFIRPSGADSSELAISVPNQIAGVEVWTEPGQWQSMKLEDGGGLVTLSIPAEAWIDDVLTVRSSMSQFFGEPGQVVTRLDAVTARTQVGELLPAGEISRRTTDFDGGGFNPQAILGVETDVVLPEDGTTFEATGELFGSFDVWRVTLAEGDQVEVRMIADGSTELDPFLTIRNPSGVQIAENDDFDGLNSGVDFVAEDSGAYEIETRPLNPQTRGGLYTVRINVTPGEGDVE